MTQEELERNRLLLDRNKLMHENAIAAAKEKEKADSAVDEASYALQSRTYNAADAEVGTEVRGKLMASKKILRGRSEAKATAVDALN
jgi:hypothetical protein